jgi:hypothetical protein
VALKAQTERQRDRKTRNVFLFLFIDRCDVRGYNRRYVKIVDADEKTLSFAQEIYDAKGKLIEIHQKFPEDKGHQRV